MKYKFLAIALLFSFVLFAQDKTLKLNHIYFVLDSVSYNDLKNNTAFQNFANFDQGLPNFKSTTDTSKTMYMRGKNTYVEIMGPHNKFSEPIGAIGIGFSWDTELPFNYTIFDRLSNNGCNEFKKYDANWKFEDKELPWYTSYYIESNSNLATWYAFYNPNFLTELYSEKKNKFSRSDFLKKSYNPNKDFIDISEITLQCIPTDFDRIMKEQECLGSEIVFSNDIKITYLIDNVLFSINKINKGNSKLKRVVLSSKNKVTIHSINGNLELLGNNKELIVNFLN